MQPHRPLFLILLLFAFAALTAPARAQRQFPWRTTIDSRSLDTLRSPDPTSSRHRYRITVSGTYSMWEDTVNSSVDGVWIYSFPAEEWAKPEWRLFFEGYPIYVGDARLLDAHGFRVDGKPFPKLPLADDHTYSMVVQGTGQPLSVNIVDWNFQGAIRRDAHDNNSGRLSVLVEELPLVEWEICAIDSSNFPQIRLAVKVMRDSVRLDDFGPDLRLEENGRAVAIERIDCSERVGAVSVAMVFDRSGSMSEPFGGATRMDYTRSAGRSFVDRLAPTDEAAIYSFSLGTRLDQDWTSGRTALKQAIDRLEPEGWTAMNDAALRAINDVAKRPGGRRKGVILLSDGEDNRSSVRSISTVIDRARELGVPVFGIGLMLDTDDSLRRLALESGGRYYSVRDPAAMDSVFASIAEIVFEKGCCSIYYTSPDSSRDGAWRQIAGRYVGGGDTTVVAPTGYHAPRSVSSVDMVSDVDRARVVPNPLDAAGGRLELGSEAGRPLSLRIIDLTGAILHEEALSTAAAATRSIPISAHALAPGRYLIVVELEGGRRVVVPLLYGGN